MTVTFRTLGDYKHTFYDEVKTVGKAVELYIEYFNKHVSPFGNGTSSNPEKILFNQALTMKGKRIGIYVPFETKISGDTIIYVEVISPQHKFVLPAYKAWKIQKNEWENTKEAYYSNARIKSTEYQFELKKSKYGVNAENSAFARFPEEIVEHIGTFLSPQSVLQDIKNEFMLLELPSNYKLRKVVDLQRRVRAEMDSPTSSDGLIWRTGPPFHPLTEKLHNALVRTDIISGTTI